MKGLTIFFLIFLTIACSTHTEKQADQNTFSTKGKNVNVYTTAQNTDLRLS